MIMPLEKQTTFGWLVGADLFLDGTGGGVFLSAICWVYQTDMVVFLK